MSNGILCFAFNNGKIDYIKQAGSLAIRVKQYLNLPTTLVTNNKNLVPEELKTHFDKILEVNIESTNTKRYYDGSLSHKSLFFNNIGRHKAYELTPYDETIVVDTDYIICNDTLKNCFKQKEEFLIYKDAVDVAGWRSFPEFEYINDTGIPFYWATMFYFKKTENTKIFFNLLDFVIKNWDHYKKVFDIGARNFRNDHAFSIAIHMMNGLVDDNWAKQPPGKMYYTLDKDILRSIEDNKLSFLVGKEDRVGEYILAGTKDLNVHVMNKFSLERLL